ncbi:MAG TPA: hypothetical protein VF670_12095 [Duganella sp.]|jgi:hypothetical protein
MFKRLFALLSPAPAPAPADNVEDDPRLVEQADAYEAAMAQFMRLVSGHLGDDESARLTGHVLSQFDGSEVAGGREAVGGFFHEGVMDEEGQQRGKWLMIAVDWKASDEIDWQANEILATRGIDDRWEWNADGKTVMEGLQVLSDWLAPHALSLLSVDFGHDAYYMLIVDDDIAREAVELGQRAGLDVMPFPDFAATEGE